MTINARAALKELDINPRQGIIRAVQSIGESIMQSPDPISYANAVIVTLGGQEQLEFARARIMAKAMVEQAVRTDRDNSYDPVVAFQYAESKVEQLEKTSPFLFVETVTNPETGEQVEPKKKGRKSAGNKKELALKMCDDNSKLENGPLAGMIAKNLSISYANAFYYVSRVWKRPTAS